MARRPAIEATALAALLALAVGCGGQEFESNATGGASSGGSGGSGGSAGGSGGGGAADSGGVGGANCPTLAAMGTFPSPTSSLLDDFNRPDGPPGASWEGAPAFKIKNNELIVISASALPESDLRHQTGDPCAGQEAWFRYRSAKGEADGNVGLLLKAQNTTTCDQLEVDYFPTNSEISVWTCAGQDVWVSEKTFAKSLADGDVLGARARADGTVEVYVNGALLGTVALAGKWEHATRAGRIGVTAYHVTGFRIDDFGGR